MSTASPQPWSNGGACNRSTTDLHNPAWAAAIAATRRRVLVPCTYQQQMVRMRETLDVRDGHRVLEIGTGTGYNAALLCHRLGAENVFSLEIDAELVAAARQRLAVIGHHPQLAARGGIDGWPHHAPASPATATTDVRWSARRATLLACPRSRR